MPPLRRGARVRALHAVVAAVVQQRLLDVEEAVEVDVLLGEPDQAARLGRLVRMAEHERLARGHADQVADRRDERGLAGAVGAEQPEELPVADDEVDAVERQEGVVVALRETAQLERVGSVHAIDVSRAAGSGPILTDGLDRVEPLLGTWPA